MQQLQEIAEYIIRQAKRKGADEIDVVILNSRRSSVRVRLGSIEELKQANPQSLGIRVFKDQRNAITYTSDFRKPSLDRLIERTVSMVKVTHRDEFAGLPQQGLLGRASADLDLYDPALPELATDKKIEMVTELEELGMAKDSLIKNSDGCSWSDSIAHFVLANSKGFYGEERHSSCSLDLTLVAEKDGVKQRDYWGSNVRHLAQLESLESIAEKAAQRTLRKVGARKPATRKVPVIFDPQTARDFITIIANTVVGDAIYKRRSFLVDQLGKKIAVDDFTLIDDGLLPRGLGSRLFDDEGLPSRRNVVFENGLLTSYLCDCYAARKLQCKPTGSASRSVGSAPTPDTSNFYLQKGRHTPQEMISSVREGLLLTDVHWVGINYVTGDYSRGAEGIWIENGKLSYPVQEFTVASNMNEMLQSIEMIGNDLEFRGSTNAPSFKMREMTISGA